MDYKSFVSVESGATPGVVYTVARMSFARRIELTRRIRDLAQRLDFLEAGEDPREKMESAILSAEIDRLYLLWGLQSISGLVLDGAAATPETLLECGPEDLFREALAAVKAQCGLTEAERGN